MARLRPDFTKSIRLTIRATLAERDMTAYDLENLSGISAKHIYRICDGEQSPTLEVLQRIFRALGKTLIVVDEASVNSAKPKS